MTQSETTAESGNFYIRPATLADSAALIALIDGVYREYGDRICLENYDADSPNRISNKGDRS